MAAKCLVSKKSASQAKTKPNPKPKILKRKRSITTPDLPPLPCKVSKYQHPTKQPKAKTLKRKCSSSALYLPLPPPSKPTKHHQGKKEITKLSKPTIPYLILRLYPPNPLHAAPGSATDAGYGVGKARGETEAFPKFDCSVTAGNGNEGDRKDAGRARGEVEQHCLKCCKHDQCRKIKSLYEVRASRFGARKVVVDCARFEGCIAW